MSTSLNFVNKSEKFQKLSKNSENQLEIDKFDRILKQNVTMEQIPNVQDH